MNKPEEFQSSSLHRHMKIANKEGKSIYKRHTKAALQAKPDSLFWQDAWEYAKAFK